MKRVVLTNRGKLKSGVGVLFAHWQEVVYRESYIKVTATDGRTFILEPQDIVTIVDANASKQ